MQISLKVRVKKAIVQDDNLTILRLSLLGVTAAVATPAPAARALRCLARRRLGASTEGWGWGRDSNSTEKAVTMSIRKQATVSNFSSETNMLVRWFGSNW